MNGFQRLAALALTAAGAVFFCGVLAATPPTASVDATVHRAMQTFQVPGIAVAVVTGGDVVHTQGYGTRSVASDEAVDARTLFRIGSVSKAFTAVALAMLVDEGALRWDDPVIDHLPEFRMHDPWVTRELTVRDLLTHRSGLPLGAGDLLIFPEGNATPGEVVLALRHLEPATSFRSEFAYDNLLYIVAGELVARVAGIEFADFMEQRVLQPLGMGDCAATASRVENHGRLATPHVLVDGKLETTTTRLTDVVAPAGGIVCSATGMTRWMSFLLAQGTVEGERLISKARYAELIEPVTLLPVPAYLREHAGAYLNAYALGWNVSTFHGRPMLSHGGGVWGMTTFLAVLPEQDLAVFATGNQLSPAPRAVVNDIHRAVPGEERGRQRQRLDRHRRGSGRRARLRSGRGGGRGAEGARRRQHAEPSAAGLYRHLPGFVVR